MSSSRDSSLKKRASLKVKAGKDGSSTSSLRSDKAKSKRSLNAVDFGSVANDNITAVVRIRPGGKNIWKVDPKKPGAITDSIRGDTFLFDNVFDTDSSTQQLYEKVAAPIVEQCLKGFNGTVFAYGQTGSGKTHTIHGYPKQELGLVGMAMQHIFAHVQQNSSAIYLLRISYIELYNEEITDLLADDGSKERKKLVVRQVGEEFVVPDVKEHFVTSPEEVEKWLRIGNNNRRVGVNNVHEQSSRSHSIFRLVMECATRVTEKSDDEEDDDAAEDSVLSDKKEKEKEPAKEKEKEKKTSLKKKKGTGTGAGTGKKKTKKKKAGQHLAGAVRVAQLNLVDLAGSETLSNEFEATQQKETKFINLSLTQLKTVIKALSEKESFIPYRNSTLTKILSNSLGGNAKTAVVCAIAPDESDQQMTRSTLHFGSMAKTITNYASVNEYADDDARVMMKQYRQQIEDLEAKLQGYQQLEHEKEQIHADYLRLKEQVENLKNKEDERAQLEAEAKGLQGVLVYKNTHKRSGSVTGVSNAMVNEIKNQLSALQDENARLESQLAEQRAEKSRAEEMILQRQRALEIEKHKAVEREVQLQDLEVQKRQLAERSAQQEAKYEQLERDIVASGLDKDSYLAQLINEHQDQTDSLRRKLNKATELISEKEIERMRVVQQNTKLKKSVQQLQAIIQSLRYEQLARNNRASSGNGSDAKGDEPADDLTDEQISAALAQSEALAKFAPSG